MKFTDDIKQMYVAIYEQKYNAIYILYEHALNALLNTGDEFFLAIYTELPTIAQHVTTLGYIPGCFIRNGSENQSMCVSVCALMI